MQAGFQLRNIGKYCIIQRSYPDVLSCMYATKEYGYCHLIVCNIRPISSIEVWLHISK